jgi:hypothetical protein
MDSEVAAGQIAEVFQFSVNELGAVFGGAAQDATRWLANGFPADQVGKAAIILEIANLLTHHLRTDRIGAIARRPAAAYGGRSMLEMIEAGEHEALLASVRASFDFCWTA